AWGVGGIEAELALLGQPLTMVVPPVVGVELTGGLAPGVTATDLVLTIAERLRAHGGVGTFTEFTRPAIAPLPLAQPAPLANVCPEFGPTAALSPVGGPPLDYLGLPARPPEHVTAVET